MRPLLLPLAAFVAAAVAIGVGACGSNAKFIGSRGPRLVEPAQVREVEQVPDGFELVGRVEVSCDFSSEGNLIGGAASGQCSEQRLRQELRQETSDAGGALLVAVKCMEANKQAVEYDEDNVERRRQILAIGCQAQVARPLKGRAGKVASASVDASAPPIPDTGPEKTLDAAVADVAVPDTPLSDASVDAGPSVVEIAGVGYRIISAAPLVDAGAPGDVRAAFELPAGARRLGRLTLQCETRCERAATEQAVRQQAALRGATVVAGLQCLETDGRWECRAELGREADGG